MQSNTTKNSVTIDDMRDALARQLGKGELDPEVFGFLGGLGALGDPARQPLRPSEVSTLCAFISDESSGDDLDIRLIGLAFEHADMVDRIVKDTDPSLAELRAAQLELVRDVAKYFIRARAFWAALSDVDAARRGRESRSAAEGGAPHGR